MPDALGQLRALVNDNKSQQVSVDSVISAMQHWFALTDSLIGTRAPGAHPHYMVLFSDKDSLKKELTWKLIAMRNIEKGLLGQREQASGESIATFRWTFVYLVMGIVALLMSAFSSIRYNFNKRIRIQENLKRTNLVFEKMFYDSPIAMVISELGTRVEVTFERPC